MKITATAISMTLAFSVLFADVSKCFPPSSKNGITYGTYDKWIKKCPNANKFVSNNKDKVLDSLKNRIADPIQNDITNSFNWSKLIKRGEDKNNFEESKAVIFDGFVVKVKHGDPETCNCSANDRDMEDTHIELAQTDKPADTVRSKRVVVEITPRIRHNKNWKTLSDNDPSLFHKWVRVTGWLAYDYHHTGMAFNTASKPNGKTIVRGTVWEVHPIVNVEVLNQP